MLEARTVGVSIPLDWRRLYDAIWPPEFFPCWASGLSQSSLVREEGDRWTAKGPEGAVSIRFTGRNAFGVMDHVVWLADGTEVHVPLRVVPNGGGAEVLLTLFRQPGMSEAKFREDVEWVARDLATLRDLAVQWPEERLNPARDEF